MSDSARPSSIQAVVDWLNRPSMMCLLLAASTFAVFGTALRFGFVTFDDGQYVTHNPMVQAGLTSKGILWAFRTSYASNWHPLTWISHMLDASVFGTGAVGPHFVNIAFHIANTLLVFLVLRTLTRAHWRSAIVAALFALHPLRVESVAWIAERKDVLCAFFGLLTIWAYAKYVREKFEIQNSIPQARDETNAKIELRKNPRFLYASALCCFALGLMSKPMLVTLPFVLLLLDFWPLGRVQLRNAGLPASGRVSLRRLVLEKIPFVILSAVSSVITIVVQQRAGAISGVAHISMIARLENALVSYFRYLAKTFWPMNLAVIYPHPGSWPWYDTVISLLIIGCITAVFVFARRLPFLAVGWLWFVGMLVPVIGIVQVGAQSMADRYSYLPSVGLFIVIVWGVSAVVDLQTRIAGTTVVLVCGVVLVACSIRTYDQLQYWRNGETLARCALSVTTDNFVAWNFLGIALAESGRLEEAKGSYEKSIKIKPDFADAYYNLGNALSREGHLNEAVKDYQDALAINPQYADALNNLGTALNRLGRDDESVAAYRKALSIRSDFADAAHNLGTVLAMQGKVDEAIPQFYHALDVAPKFAEAQNILGYLLMSKGRTRAAEQHFREALAINPNYVDAINNLANLLISDRRSGEAILISRRVLAIKPTSAEAFRNLGAAFLAEKSLSESATNFEAALKLEPNDPVTRFQLASVLLQLNQSQAAIAQLNEALRLNPNFTPAKEQLRLLGIEPQN